MNKYLIFSFLGLLISIFYYTNEVLEARKVTLEKVEAVEAQIENPLTIEEMGIRRLRTLLEVQDLDFYSHGGTDFFSGRVTTITQSLVKSLYFKNFRPGIAKIKQSLIAFWALDPMITKDRQLELFLNWVYLGDVDGEPVRGFPKAAEVYFNKSFSELTEEEFLSLLVMLTSPNGANVKTPPKVNAEGVETLKKNLSRY